MFAMTYQLNIIGSLSSIGPKLRARAVAVAYPNIPINKAGNTNLFHSFACAIAAAVVGPPTLALLARYNSLGGRRKIPLPMVIKVPKWTKICSNENRNNDGACVITIAIDPAAPDAAKNIWTKTTPSAVPV